jgi:hypothetical protein
LRGLRSVNGRDFASLFEKAIERSHKEPEVKQVTKAQLDQLEERGYLNPGDRGITCSPLSSPRLTALILHFAAVEPHDSLKSVKPVWERCGRDVVADLVPA